jgi:hypothetical protein
MERYKIKLPTREAFNTVLDLLAGSVALYVASEKRRSMSTGHLSADQRAKIAALGGEVTAELRYDLDALSGS